MLWTGLLSHSPHYLTVFLLELMEILLNVVLDTSRAVVLGDFNIYTTVPLPDVAP